MQRQRSYPATAECAWSGAERDSLFWRCLKCKTRVCWGSTSIYARHQQQIQLSWQDPVWSLYWDANLSESFFDHLMTQWGLLHTAVPIVFKLCHGLCWPNRCPDVLQTDLHHKKSCTISKNLLENMIESHLKAWYKHRAFPGIPSGQQSSGGLH